MSFPGSQAYAHATLRVDDLAAAQAFFVDVLGLRELAREDGIVYLGCGYDDNHDLALALGGTGVEEFALGVPDGDALDRIARRLAHAGVDAHRAHDDALGVRDALRFALPGGQRAAFVVTADRRPLETYRPAHPVSPGAPLDADHINLMAPDVRALTTFLCDVLGFRASDLTVPPDEEPWLAAWLRRSPGHHDVAISLGAAGETLHHVAFAYAGIDHLKHALDRLAAAGHRLELGLGRHPVGANLYAYLWTPGGNRIELCAEGAILSDASPTRSWPSMRETLNAWSDAPPPSTFGRGS